VSTQNEIHTTTMPSFDVSGELTLGTMTVVGVAGDYKIWQPSQYPSLVADEKTWSKQIPNMGDNSEVVSRCMFVFRNMSWIFVLSYIMQCRQSVWGF
jgi:hypothetical protein